MASLGELSVPTDGTEYLDLDDWAVKQKFCFSLALFLCAEAEELGCTWRCRAWETKEGLWVLSIVSLEHAYIGRAGSSPLLRRESGWILWSLDT